MLMFRKEEKKGGVMGKRRAGMSRSFADQLGEESYQPRTGEGSRREKKRLNNVDYVWGGAHAR